MTPPFSSTALALPQTSESRTAPSVRAAPKAKREPPTPQCPRHLALVLDTHGLGDAAAPAQSLEAMRDLVCGCLDGGIEWLSVFVPEELVADRGAFEALESFVRTQSEALALWGI